jgi:hypothetical protein
MSKNQPHHVIKRGAVRASLFRNLHPHQGRAIALWKVALEVRYQDKQGRWRSAASLSINEIPKAIAALQEAYDYLLTIANRPPHHGSASSDGDAGGDRHVYKP